MTQEEIISMAIGAGADVLCGSMGMTTHAIFSRAHMQRFAGMVAAAEREACALACESIETRTWAAFKGDIEWAGESGRADARVYGMSDGASECATAIRARGGNV